MANKSYKYAIISGDKVTMCNDKTTVAKLLNCSSKTIDRRLREAVSFTIKSLIVTTNLLFVGSKRGRRDINK